MTGMPITSHDVWGRAYGHDNYEKLGGYAIKFATRLLNNNKHTFIVWMLLNKL
jgi:hypothetical protein